MTRLQALLLAAAVGTAVVAGAFAAFRTTQLSSRPAAARVSSAEIARQNRALDRAEAALRAELRRKPPRVAAVPARAAAPPATVVYRRPPAIVHVIHRHGEHEGAEADGGQGFDD